MNFFINFTQKVKTKYFLPIDRKKGQKEIRVAYKLVASILGCHPDHVRI